LFWSPPTEAEFLLLPLFQILFLPELQTLHDEVREKDADLRRIREKLAKQNLDNLKLRKELNELRKASESKHHTIPGRNRIRSRSWQSCPAIGVGTLSLEENGLGK
jgi:hypothetical protein